MKSTVSASEAENASFTNPNNRQYKYYDLVMAAFVTVLLCSNLIGVSKRSYIPLPFTIHWGNWEMSYLTFGTGILFFPISYVFGDVLTEVYGYARSRRVIWAGFGALIFASFMSYVVVNMPPAPGWTGQEIYEKAFGSTWRIVFASLLAFWAGEFANSVVLAKMKVGTEGRFLWLRTIGSTVAGEAVDSMIFYPLAFFGAEGWTTEAIITVMLTNYCLKVLWEALITPITYRVVAFLKRAENEDYYDRNTNFNPFTLET